MEDNDREGQMGLPGVYEGNSKVFGAMTEKALPPPRGLGGVEI